MRGGTLDDAERIIATTTGERVSVTMKPALTAKDWADKMFEATLAPTCEATVIVRDVDVFIGSADGACFRGADRHALAAIALYDQPYGFTREDVNFVHYLADLTHDETNRKGAQELADRIEALLPPEG